MGPGVQAQSGGAAAAAVQVAVATALTLWVFDGRTLVKGSYLFELKPSRAKRKRPTRRAACRGACALREAKGQYAEGNLFDSGTINRLTNPSGVFSHTFEQGEGTFGVGLTVVGLRRRLVDVAAQGSVKVEQAACGSFDSCLTCLILPHCIWCSGNQTCLGRNESTNMPKDADVVIEAMPAAAGSGRKFEHLKYYAPEGGFRNYGLTW